MLSVIVAGRNDDYGKDFRQRLFRTALHNCELFTREGIPFEYILAEWNPLPDRPLLSEEFVHRVPNARAVVIPPEIHRQYSLNPGMPFHEMPAKNAALRRSCGDVVILTNADVLFAESLVARIAAGRWHPRTLYRAHRIDVKSDLSWDELQAPANQLASGEGMVPPPYYLGAGGDFCLALREVWSSLGGFNEQIRFSTRAKDWQFFLSAATQDIAIEFIGDVYHLDHDQGFRNTPSDKRNAEGAHFGNWWDIEFGLPISIADNWGFADVSDYASNTDLRIATLDANGYEISAEQDNRDRHLMTWLTRPADSADSAGAMLLHAICAAHYQGRRLICRIEDPRLAVTLAGFDCVAAPFGVEIRSNWTWPEMPGYTLRPFLREPASLQHTDLIVQETDGHLFVFGAGAGFEVDVLPRKVPVGEPEFNPVLARRLLYAYLNLQEQGTTAFAIYGAGSHTKSVLSWGVPDRLALLAIVETGRRASDLALPCFSVSEACSRLPADAAVLLSSSSFESDMLQACRDHGIPNVVALYSDWPRDFWKIGVVTYDTTSSVSVRS